MSSRSLVLLGSTGSIGTQAEAVIKGRDFNVIGLAAGGTRTALLAQQIVDLRPRVVGLPDPAAVATVAALVSQLTGGRTVECEYLAGPDAAAQVAGIGADVVLNGMTGAIGLAPTLAALTAGSRLALANKESLVAGGPLVKAAQQYRGQIVPVDSEHSALAQCLRSGTADEVARLILTASGGPFRGWSRRDLANVTVEAALAHPTWTMGPVVTVNSATMMNKALELIEAHYLFDIPPDRIDVVVHPQSYVHSLVEFIDGATLAQISPPDMRLPIALGLSWPKRLTSVSTPTRFESASVWDFEPLDETVFTAIGLARAAVAASPLHPAVMNAANEVCVTAFLAGRLSFLAIVETVTRVVETFTGGIGIGTGTAARRPDLAAITAAQDWARAAAADLIGL